VPRHKIQPTISNRLISVPHPSLANTSPWNAIAGQYQLRPGTQPGVLGQRPVLGDGRLGQLLQGQRGDAVVRNLGIIFTLCAHAHRRAATMALTAAQGEKPIDDVVSPPAALWLETARDHLRSMALDWPQRLPITGTTASAPPDLTWLQGCPLPLVARGAPVTTAAALDQLGQLRGWLESHILGQSIAHWRQAHAEPLALADWCQAHAGHLPPARFLHAWQPMASRLHMPARCLRVLHLDPSVQQQQLTELARDMVHQSGFVQQPTWHGQCVENGPWTRLRHGPQPVGMPRSAWWRLSARWLELLALAEAGSMAASASQKGVAMPALTASPALHAGACAANTGTAPLLATGALWLAPGQALAWCEMARGLLLHWVQLDAQGGVLDYRVLAPTEWNFHPQGALAQAVSKLASDDHASATLLAAAFDPCVSCTVFGATVAP